MSGPNIEQLATRILGGLVDDDTAEYESELNRVSTILREEIEARSAPAAGKVPKVGKYIHVPGPCDGTCKHRGRYEDMEEPCRSCQHIHVVKRGVSVHTLYVPADIAKRIGGGQG